MSTHFKSWALLLGAAGSASAMTPLATPAEAQGWRGSSACRGLDGRDRARCERRDNRYDRQRERERDRRKDAKTDGIVAGVIGTALLGGIIAAAASKKKDDRGRRSDCEERYGNYDEQTDQYRASDGRWYPCT